MKHKDKIELYVKTNDGVFIPIVLEEMFSDPSEWDGSFMLVRVGSKKFVPSFEDLEKIRDMLTDCDAVSNIKDASFLVVGSHENIQFERADFKKLETK